MALCINSSFCNSRAPTHPKFLCKDSSSSLTRSTTPFSSSSSSSSSSPRGISVITRARRASPRTTRQGEEKNQKKQQQQQLDLEEEEKEEVDDGFVLPELPGEKPDFWEGPQWNGFGFFVQYQWAFGIGFALIACAIAVATYNEGATDFKKTPVYQESIQQSRELLDQQDDSTPDVFEANPTEEAPNLD